MKTNFDLTKSEYEIMKIIWDSDVPMLKQDILKVCGESKWTDNYLKKVLTVLYQKGAIKAVGVSRVGKINSRLYVPTVTEDEYNISKYPVQSLSTLANIIKDMYKEADDEAKAQIVADVEKLSAELKNGNID